MRVTTSATAAKYHLAGRQSTTIAAPHAICRDADRSISPTVADERAHHNRPDRAAGNLCDELQTYDRGRQGSEREHRENDTIDRSTDHIAAIRPDHPRTRAQERIGKPIG